MVLYMYAFILLKCIAYIAKGIKTLKIMKNNGTAVRGLKNVYITARESESESEI